MFGTVFFCMGLEVLMAVTEEYGCVIGNIAQFRKCPVFQKIVSPHLQGQRKKLAKADSKQNEHEGDIFLQNAGLVSNYMTLQHRTPYSLYPSASNIILYTVF
jgi:hypothetical protein